MNPSPKAGLPLAELFQTWRGHSEAGFPVEEYRRLAKEANNHGASLVAFDIADAGLKRFANDPKLVQMKALALARLGSGEAARRVLKALCDAGHDDEETLGLIARTHKDTWLETGSHRDLQVAYDSYWTAYNGKEANYWTGINAATLSFARERKTPELAGKLLADCRKLAEKDPTDYWLPATMGEAQLLLGDLDEAVRLYSQARRSAALGNVIAMWRNVQIIARVHLQGAEITRRIQRALRPPKVALLRDGWSGDLEQTREDLHQDGVAVAYSTAASERDLSFLELLQSMDGQTHIVLPYNEEQFIADHLAGLEDRYRKIKAKAHDVIVCAEQEIGSSNSGEIYAANVLHGLAEIRAAQMDTGLIEIGKHQPPAVTSSSGFGVETRAFLFADAVHFSKLAENQLPEFIAQVLNRAAALARNYRPKPETQNTWGDGLFFAFASAADAGLFALRLTAGIAAIDRAAAGLPEELKLRIGLHAGPVRKVTDQITGRENFIGSHVSRAARIEPVTPAGTVYVSEPFAALATLAMPALFRFDYVGRQPLAKAAGTVPLYELRRY